MKSIKTLFFVALILGGISLCVVAIIKQYQLIYDTFGRLVFGNIVIWDISLLYMLGIIPMLIGGIGLRCKAHWRKRKTKK